MKRREFIVLLGGAAAAASPLGAQAQPKVIRRVGFLGGVNVITPQSENYRAFLAQLDELGFRAGRNVIVEYKALADPRGPAGSAGELMRSKPDVIVVTGPEVALQAVLAAIKGTSTSAVFFATQYDPAEQKYVASLDKPGGNVTGILMRPSELAAKQIELLTETLPGRKRIAVLWDNETADQFAAIEKAGKAAGLDILPIRHERPPYSIELSFKNIVARKAHAAIFLPSPHFGGRRSKIAELAIKRKLPTLLGSKAYVESGGLMALGIDYPAALRKLADYTGKILRGEKAANLPVDASPKLELTVNTKTAQAIGVELPAEVTKRANHVVDH
jgi:putative ABC transport system substrate-binding protein